MKTYLVQVDEGEKIEMSGFSPMSVALSYAGFNNSTIDMIKQNAEYLATQRYTGITKTIKIEVK